MTARGLCAALGALALVCSPTTPSAAAANASATAPLPPQMHTVAGRGSCSGLPTYGGGCDGVAANTVPIGQARSVASLPSGGFLYVDYYGDLVREVSPSGTVTTVAGDGTTSDAPDGSIAVQSGLNGPVSVAPLPGGGFLVTEYNGSVVRMVSPGSPATATITTIAGTGVPGPGTTNGQSTAIPLDYPTDAEPTSDGRLLIADTGDNAIRVVSGLSVDPTAATIATIAGGGSCDDASTSCEGSSAGAVRLNHPVSVSPIQGGSGGYLIAESDAAHFDDTIREISQISPSGTFTTVAGTPGHQPGFAGDGGPATAAQLNNPEQVLSTADGGFVIADTGNEVIRRVSPSGTITTVAGTPGVASYAGDGGAATAAALQSPAAVAPAPAGGLLIADADNAAIRAVTIPPTTAIALSPATPNGQNGWYTSAVNVTLSTTNASQTSCFLDPAGAPTVFDELLTPCAFTVAGGQITGDGSHVLYAASVDALGDKELPVASASVKIDSTPPSVWCAWTTPRYVVRSVGRLTATVADNESGPTATGVVKKVATTHIGPNSAHLTGSDKAGNTTTVSCPYRVIPKKFSPAPVVDWKLSGASTVNPAKTGATHGNQRKPARGTVVLHLSVKNVARDAVLRLGCTGKTCPFRAVTCRRTKCSKERLKRLNRGRAKVDAFDLAPLFAKRVLAPGVKLSVSVTRRDTDGWSWLLTVRGGKATSHNARCLPPASDHVDKHC